MSDMEEARARMIAKRFGGNAKGASTGGGGAPRRKKKAVHKSASTGVLFIRPEGYAFCLFFTNMVMIDFIR